MARLPQPGGDQGNWGVILNDFLNQSLNSDGSLKPGVVDASAIVDGTISEAKLDSAAQTKLNSGGTAGVVSVNTRSGAVTLTAADVGLANASNTSDANKPISAATQTALNAKEATVTAGSTSQYYRGDKSWQTLDKAAVGLANVDNTSDTNKPISSATQTALNAKADSSALTSGLAGKANSSHTHAAADITDLTETTQDTIASTLVAGTNVTLNYNDGAGTLTVSATPGAGVTDLSTTYAADSVTVISSTGNDAVIDDATTSNAGVLSAADKTKLDGIQTGAEANTVDSVAGKTGVVTLVKADVGLANVDNTTDANKPISTATQTALNAKADTSSLSGYATTTDLSTGLSGKANTSHTHTASQISDSTATGRSVLTAIDASAARTAIGAGTSSLALGTTSVTAKAGDYAPTKADVGLANVDNTSDLNKPISTATQAAIDAKADATAVGAKVLLIDQAVDLPPGTPAGVVVVVKNP